MKIRLRGKETMKKKEEYEKENKRR